MAAVAAATLLATACTGEDRPKDDATRYTLPPGPLPLVRHDPPLAFHATDRPVRLPADARTGTTLLHGWYAYVAGPGSLRMVSLVDGHPVGTAGADRPGAVGTTPAFVTFITGNVVLETCLARAAGQDGSRAHSVVEFTAMNSLTGRTSWSFTVDLPELYDPDASFTLLGVHDDTAVVTASDAEHSVVLAVNLWNRVPLWSHSGATGAAYVGGPTGGGQVIVLEPTDDPADDPAGGPRRRTLTALGLERGQLLWSSGDFSDAKVTPAGPDRMIVQSRSPGSGRNIGLLVNAATGWQEYDFSGGPAYTCRYDELKTVVCGAGAETTGDTSAFALDPVTGKVLWTSQDKAPREPMPVITAVWHGRIYGRTANGAATLDAATGSRSLQDPHLAPVLLNEFVGLSGPGGDGSELAAYVTVG
ncbi:hypothetical protein [Kitasatospora sp. NPDC101183]|uniref:hypothetical protein n=1 Tax=Kitasatospora sp. NPDC101183 TaxID=3364100 RepID=UPI003813B669